MIRLSACSAVEATRALRHRASVRPASAVSARRKSRSAALFEAEGFVGILQGADQNLHRASGHELFDGTIRTITQNDLVIVQQVNDPLSLEKQREVRKVLRQVEAK